MTEVFNGESSGKKERNKYFDLKFSNARYVKLINLGNSAGSAWASITNCAIIPPNADSSIGIAETAICDADDIIADGEKIELYGEDYLLNDVTWVNAAGTYGYVFLKEKTENMGDLKARWTNAGASCFELWFSHGANPTNGGYAYILLHGQRADETAAYASDTRISSVGRSMETNFKYK